MDTMRERFERVTGGLLDSNPRLAVVTADIGATAFESARRRHPDRVINLGIREQLLIGVTSGLALTGMRPVAHTFAPFLVERPFEQIKLDIVHQGVGAVLVSHPHAEWASEITRFAQRLGLNPNGNWKSGDRTRSGRDAPQSSFTVGVCRCRRRGWSRRG